MFSELIKEVKVGAPVIGRVCTYYIGDGYREFCTVWWSVFSLPLLGGGRAQQFTFKHAQPSSTSSRKRSLKKKKNTWFSLAKMNQNCCLLSGDNISKTSIMIWKTENGLEMFTQNDAERAQSLIPQNL